MLMQNASAFVSTPSLMGLKKSEIRSRPSVSVRMQVDLLQRVEALKLLTTVSKTGLLSKVEEAGLFSKLEEQVQQLFCKYGYVVLNVILEHYLWLAGCFVPS